MTTYTKKTTTTETLYSTYKNYEKESLLNKIRNRKQHKNLRQEIKELEKETTAILTKYNELKNKTVFSPFKKNYLRKNTPNIKLYSTDYANFIKSKFNSTTIESFGLESIYIFLSLILIPICFSYYILMKIY